jgi:exopolyphosphatase/guanosine-5'-triphosphate,3'-diphosphate pyrophosphatase
VIRNADLLGFDQTEIGLIATIALFHHKSFPRSRHPEYAELDKRSREIVRILCTFLRIAESLDRSHLGAVGRVRLVAGERKNVILELAPARDCHLELWELKSHEKAFEKVFDRQLVVKVLEPVPAAVPAGR